MEKTFVKETIFGLGLGSRNQWAEEGVNGKHIPGSGSKCNSTKKWKCLACLENVKMMGWRDRDCKKALVKEAGFATWTFSSSSETIFCWVRRKRMRIRWTTFLSNPHGLKKRRGKRTWQNVSWLLPNPKYLKHHTRHISNPNTCLDSPTPNCSCGHLIKWIVYKRTGSDGGGSLKRMTDVGWLASLPLRMYASRCPCGEREGASVELPTKLLIWLPCRTVKTHII